MAQPSPLYRSGEQFVLRAVTREGYAPLDIRYAEESHLRIASITPANVIVLLPFPGGRPLLVEGNLRVVAHPESYGPWRTIQEWRRWVESFASRNQAKGA